MDRQVCAAFSEDTCLIVLASPSVIEPRAQQLHATAHVRNRFDMPAIGRNLGLCCIRMWGSAVYICRRNDTRGSRALRRG